MKSLFIFFFLIGSIHAQLLHDYELNGDYFDALGGNPIIPNGGYLNSSEYVFGIDQGPNVSGVIDSASYSIEMRFTPSDVWGWHKILDFKNRTSDSGLYIYDGQFVFFPIMWLAGPYVFESGQPTTVQFSRNGITKQITGCVNGSWQWTLTDVDDDATFTGTDNIIQILIDDFGGSDPMAGSLDYFKIYNFNGIAFDLELGDTVFTCDPYVINPGVTGVDFHWSDGSSSPTLSVTQSGTYSLTISDGCFAADIDSVEVIFEGMAEGVDIGPPEITFCEGDSYVISLDPGIGDYEWQDGSTDSEYVITTTGIYQVSFDDGCDITTDAISVLVTDMILPEITGVPGTICENDNPFSLPTVQNGITGIWSGPGIANNVFDPAGLNGNIAISFIPDQGQCASSAETFIEVITCSIPPCEIPGYTFGGNFDGHSYYVSDATATWNDAKLLATNIGGHLATISNAGENSFVAGVAALTYDPFEAHPGAWIGLADEVVEGTFVWVNGEPLIYTNWDPGEPNDFGGQEDYTEIYIVGSEYGNWNDFPAFFDDLEYVVEFDTETCDCNDPLNAGDDNSITVCNDTPPFNLTEELGGNPDPGGTWSPALASGGNIYDPIIDGPGLFTYTVSAPDCPSDAAIVTVAVIVSFTPVISGVPSNICESDNPLTLPTTQDGVTGNWSGPGITNNVFDPAGMNGTITILFTPDPGQCAMEVTTDINVDPLIVLTISGVPDSLCQFNSPIILQNIQTGVGGNWSGNGVFNNVFDPSGLYGIIVLTFTPDAGICALPANTTISVFQNLYNISGIAPSVCEMDMPIQLPVLQNGIIGNWSGPGVINNTFDPEGQNGIVTLVFSPDPGQCADVQSQNIIVNTFVIPSIIGIPYSLCVNSLPIPLLPIQNNINGSWSGQGVTSNEFSPEGLSGNIILTFTPDAGQCAGEATTNIYVDQLIPITISGIPDSLCAFNSPISLPYIQSGIPGSWTGDGVTNETFNPAGLNGNIILTFEPDNGNCALPVTDTVVVLENTYFISGIPASVCDNATPIPLSPLQDEVTGNWSGPGVSNNSFNPNNQNGNITLNFIPENGQCAIPSSIAISVSSAIIPIITGVPSSLCHSDSSILLPGLQDGITGNWSGLNVNSNSFSPSGLYGNYALTFSPIPGQCADTTTISMAVFTPPSFINLIAACDTIAETYTVSFEIIGGDSASYLVNGIPVNGSLFTSSPFLADSTNYAFTLDDGNGCGPVEIVGSINCACGTHAGTMNFGGSPLKICTGSDFSVSFNEDAQLDQDDLFEFVLHDNAGTQLGTIYAISNDTAFTVPPGIILGQTYFVSVIAGSNDGTGVIDLSDPCLSVSPGIPVIFYEPQITLNGGGEICSSACMTYTFSLAGETPFELMYQVNANGVVTDHFLMSDSGNVSIQVCPGDYGLTDGTIDIIPLTLVDANCAQPLSSFPGTQTIVHPATSSIISDVLCPGEFIMVNGVVYDQSHPSGTEIISNPPGCDSTIQINLTYFPEAVYYLNESLCFGGSITINGTEYNETHAQGTEILPKGAHNGCDSIINIQLTFDSIVTAQLSTTLCQGESLIINNKSYDELNPIGTEIFRKASVLGCDSILNIQLSFYPQATSILNPVVCRDEMIIINGVIYDVSHPSGTEVLQDSSYFGCDSVLNIQLSFYPEALSNINPILCPDESISINGTLYNENHPSGTEVLQDSSYFGCDSTVQINISFYPDAIGYITDTLSADESIIIQGAEYNQHNPIGAEIIPGGSAMGCDSTIVIRLTFNEEGKLYVPTVFSPNGDGINDTWSIYSDNPNTELVSLSILDRWGGLIYHRADKALNDSGVEWDGTLKGKEMEGGVYVFMAVVKTNNGASRKIKGNITLIR